MHGTPREWSKQTAALTALTRPFYTSPTTETGYSRRPLAHQELASHAEMATLGTFVGISERIALPAK